MRSKILNGHRQWRFLHVHKYFFLLGSFRTDDDGDGQGSINLRPFKGLKTNLLLPLEQTRSFNFR